VVPPGHRARPRRRPGFAGLVWLRIPALPLVAFGPLLVPNYVPLFFDIYSWRFPFVVELLIWAL
jgi:hypothetical protein